MKSWTFETLEIANSFDNHVREQLPWYDMVTDAVIYIVRNYLTENQRVVDIGASTGNMIDRLNPLLIERQAYALAIEKSEPMVDKLSKRFKDYHHVDVKHEDIISCHLDLSQVHIMFLTMMFIPVHQREMVLNRIRAKTKKGGVIVLVDKVCDHGGYFATVLKRLTMNFKLQQGAKPEDVLIKEMSLAGVQIPIDPAILGSDAKQFFRMGEFAGWVIET